MLSRLIQMRLHLEQLRELGHPLLESGLVHPISGGRPDQMLTHGQGIIQQRGLGNVRQCRPVLLRRFRQRTSLQRYLAGLRLKQPENMLHRRALPGAVQPDQSDHLAGFDREVNIVENGSADTVAAGQPFNM